MLTIAIPTFNRAALLDKQLAWLAGSVRGHEDKVELVVSDNASTDGTPDVIERWKEKLGEDLLRVRRQPENVGAIRNIAACIGQAEKRHVWTISDDDEIAPGAVDAVLDRLSRHPDLGLLTLNFSSRFVQSGRLRFSRCWSVEEEVLRRDGAAALAELFKADVGGVALTTAHVYRADLARDAMRSWGPNLDNLMVQIYWTAYCAYRGQVLVTKDTHLECAAGRHFFLDDPMLHFRLGFADLPEVGERLAALGYPWEVAQRAVLKPLAPHQIPVVKAAARHDPRQTAATLAHYTAALRRVGAAATTRHLARVLHGRLQKSLQRQRADGNETRERRRAET